MKNTRRISTCLLLATLLGAALGGFPTTRSAGAQFIYNPDSNPATGTPNKWPFSDYKNWRFMFIIDAAQIGTGPFKITDLAFAPSMTARFQAQHLQVRMNHTTFKDMPPNTPGIGFDDVLGTCPTICYDGPFRWSTTANQWVDLGLDCTFGHVGGRNIAVEIRYQGGTASTLRLRTSPAIERAWTHDGGSADPYNDPDWLSAVADGPKHRLTIDKRCVLISPPTVKLGAARAIPFYNAPVGSRYRLLASFGQTPVDLGPCKICLTPDALLWASWFGGPPTFTNYTGTVGATGSGFGTIQIPAFTPLVGTCIFHAAFFMNRSITCCTNTDGLSIVP